MKNKTRIGDRSGAHVVRGGRVAERLSLCGVYDVWCTRSGVEIWRDKVHNLVTTGGAAYLLDAALSDSQQLVGPYLGLISSASYTTGPAISDRMNSHSGWTEAGTTNAPQWDNPANGARASCVAGFDAASNANPCIKALAAVKSFHISQQGTAKGTFIVISTGAVATNLNQGGVLLSAGLFAQGDKLLQVDDVLNATWSLSFELLP